MTTTEKLPMVTPADWVAGPGQGQWTYTDYAALPEDGRRYEILNGVLYMTPSPSWSHQEVVGAFYRYLYTYVTSTGLGGVFVAPIDVELAPEDVFQPDVVVLLKASRGSEQYQIKKSSMANRYARFDSGEPRVFNTAPLA